MPWFIQHAYLNVENSNMHDEIWYVWTLYGPETRAAIVGFVKLPAAAAFHRRAFIFWYDCMRRRRELYFCDISCLGCFSRATFSYLELHHRVLAELVSAGSSDLIQSDEFGLVADAIALKAPYESCLTAILPCTHTHTLQSAGQPPANDLSLPQSTAFISHH